VSATSRLSPRAKARLAKMRRDPFGRLCLEVARYLQTVGWNVIVSGKASVRGFEQPGLGRYEFVLEFSGGRSRAGQADPAVDPHVSAEGATDPGTPGTPTQRDEEN
jgi:hypothetical protein